MNNNIDNLLNSYFDGCASAEEEKALKTYFGSSNIQIRHEIYAPLFAAFDNEKQIKAPDFAIPAENKKRTLQKLWIASASAAAIILLVITLFPISKAKTESDYVVFINGKEISNPQKARQYADKMFAQAEDIIRTSYEPFIEVNEMQTAMDADKVFNDLYKKINHIKSEKINF